MGEKNESNKQKMFYRNWYYAVFFSGLAGTLILIFLLPVTLSAAIIFSIIAIIKKWKKR